MELFIFYIFFFGFVGGIITLSMRNVYLLHKLRMKDLDIDELKRNIMFLEHELNGSKNFKIFCENLIKKEKKGLT